MSRGRPSKQTLAHPNIDATSPIAGAPKCPSELSDVAKKKWKQVVALLSDAGTVTKLDLDLLTMYCEAFSRWQSALTSLGDDYILHGENGSYQNPLLHVANKAMDQMLKLSKFLGLDKVTAKKLGVDARPAKAARVESRDRSKGPPPPKPKEA